MPLGEPPDDPVLLGVLESGDFEYYLRVGSRAGGGTRTATLLEKFFPAMTAQAKAWLLQAVEQSISAANAMRALAEGERLSADVIPHVPSKGILDAIPGDIVALNHNVFDNGRSAGADMGLDTTSILVMPPTAGELAESRQEMEKAVRDKYDMGGIEFGDMLDVLESLQAIYQVS